MASRRVYGRSYWRRYYRAFNALDGVGRRSWTFTERVVLKGKTNESFISATRSILSLGHRFVVRFYHRLRILYSPSNSVCHWIRQTSQSVGKLFFIRPHKSLKIYSIHQNCVLEVVLCPFHRIMQQSRYLIAKMGDKKEDKRHAGSTRCHDS